MRRPRPRSTTRSAISTTPTVRAPISGTATQVDNIQVGRFVAGRHADPERDRRPGALGRRQSEGNRHHLSARRPEGLTLDVDSFPDHTFKGTVIAVSPGTGAQFSILPPQNATGNWVKVVQRVPVRIAFDKDEDTKLLRSGMSVSSRSTPATAGCRSSRRRRKSRQNDRDAFRVDVAEGAAHADHGVRHDRDHHAGARHHHRQRRAALYAGLALGFARPDQLGAHLLYRRRRHHDRAGRLDGRPLRPQEAVHHLRRRLHRRVVLVRAGAEHRADGAVPPVAGHGRRSAGAAVAVGAARRLYAGGTRLGDGDLGRRRDAGADHGPDAGRLADRQLFLALGVPDQPADRRHHRDRHAAVHGGNARGTNTYVSTGSASSRSPSASARCNCCSTAASRSAGSAPARSGSR